MTIKKQKRLDKKELNKRLKQWSLSVRIRDNNTCQVCGYVSGTRLNKAGSKISNQAHHLIKGKQLKYELVNGITVCPNCHKFSQSCSFHRNALVAFKRIEVSKKEQLKELWDLYLKDRKVI